MVLLIEVGFSPLRETHNRPRLSPLRIRHGSGVLDLDHQFDAAIQFLDGPRKSDNPWSEFIGPVRILEDAAANTACNLRRQQPLPSGQEPRLIVMRGRGMGERLKTVPLNLKFLINYSNLGKTYAEHNAINAEIENMCGQHLVCALPMPVALSNTGVRPVRTFDMTEGGTSRFITRESCARWMVDLAVGKLGTEFDGKRVVLSKWKLDLSSSMCEGSRDCACM